jgi:glycosyltransferase involved in cell wall biosynthesis
MMLAKGLRENGCEAKSLTYQVAWDGRRPDIIVDLANVPGGALGRLPVQLATFLKHANDYDVFHLHFGRSFLPRLMDVPWLRKRGATIVFHFHGCEVRNRAHMLTHHRLATCTECDPFCIPAKQREILAGAAKYADRSFFSTLDLAESIPGGVHLPLAIEWARWDEAARANPLPDRMRRNGIDGPVVIAHAPTDRLIKGTRHVEAAVERLKQEFPRVELRLIEGRPWAEMPEFVAGCDILVDQLMMGWYGLLAIEGMAESRTVVAYIREDFRNVHPDLPVVSAEPATIYEVLRELVRDPARREQIGERGRMFAREHHDTRVVGEILLKHYRELRGAA